MIDQHGKEVEVLEKEKEVEVLGKEKEVEVLGKEKEVGVLEKGNQIVTVMRAKTGETEVTETTKKTGDEVEVEIAIAMMTDVGENHLVGDPNPKK